MEFIGATLEEIYATAAESFEARLRAAGMPVEYEDWVDLVAGRLDPRRALISGRLRPRGSLRALGAARGLFG